MQKRHVTIPVFIPQLGCPFECIYCNQRNITGRKFPPSRDEVEKIITAHLSTIPRNGCIIDVGFFGGNFTGIPLEHQEKYLKTVASFVDAGAVDGIRVSTRPDYIDDASLSLLKKYGVGTVELGAQSCDDEVLMLAGRGHTVAQIREASKLVITYSMQLGLQMMIGLPGDTLEKSFSTAVSFVEMEAAFARIYPALVIRGTGLEELYRKGKYSPLDLEEAIVWTKEIMRFFEKKEVRVIRVGLHPTEGLLSRESLVAGPFHPSLRELVLTDIWKDIWEDVIKNKRGDQVTLMVAPEAINHAVGYQGKNRNFLKTFFRSVIIKTAADLSGRQYRAYFG